MTGLSTVLLICLLNDNKWFNTKLRPKQIHLIHFLNG